MATPAEFLPPAAVPPVLNDPTPLDDAVCKVLVDLASLPLRTGTQEGPGVLRKDGLGPDMLRQLVLRWCTAMREKSVFDPEELSALEQAIADFSDAELTSFVEGAAIAYVL
jgi:hypothetical protein